MKINLGTTSDDKKKILIAALSELNISDYTIEGHKVDSEITDQPLDEEMTLQGARNRARNALAVCSGSLLGVGLEGGLVMLPGDTRYYLVCVAVIRDKGNHEYVGVSGKLALPQSVSDYVMNGGEFGVAIREYESQVGIDNEYTRELVTRKQSFITAIQNAFRDYCARSSL